MKTNTNASAHPKRHNNLLRARHRAGLERKQVALLLSKKTTDEISRYERGIYPPNLVTALKLEIIYAVPLRLLFQELFEKLQNEIAELRRENAGMFSGEIKFLKSFTQLRQDEFCFYAELLQDRMPSEEELQAATRHVISLHRAVSDCRQQLQAASGHS